MKTVATIASAIFLGIVFVFVWLGMNAETKRVYADYGMYVTERSTLQLTDFSVTTAEDGRKAGEVEFLKIESRGQGDPAMLEYACIGLMFEPPSDPALPAFDVDDLRITAVEEQSSFLGPTAITRTTQDFRIEDETCVAVTEAGIS